MFLTHGGVINTNFFLHFPGNVSTIISILWSYSSAVEHYVDIVGVTGSIPVVTTMLRLYYMKIVLLILFLISLLGGISLLQQSTFPEHSLFYIKGNDICNCMRIDGAFAFPEPFYLIKNRVSTGEYQIKQGETILSVMTKMLNGERVIRKITIPEGYTVRQVVEKLNENNLLFEKIVNIPAEASIMPNTYFYTFGNSRSSVLMKMSKEMEKLSKKIDELNKTSLSTYEILILASIIEKETANTEEMPTISSVYHNRLKINMRLQSDPTVIYAISNGYGKLDHKLTKNDLFFKSPYNTYRNLGFPPTPICCPGENAIMAAMFPAKTDYLYFVANKQKTGHLFAKTFKEHLKNKRLG